MTFILKSSFPRIAAGFASVYTFLAGAVPMLFKMGAAADFSSP
jgi:hypothetical protein